MTKKQLEDYCIAEFENIEMVLRELSGVVEQGKSEYGSADLAAIATFLHNSYNGIENVLKRILTYEAATVIDTPTWHKDLLRMARERGIIEDDLQAKLGQYLSFRHFFIHGYSFGLRWTEMKPLVDSIYGTISWFRARTLEHIQTLK